MLALWKMEEKCKKERKRTAEATCYLSTRRILRVMWHSSRGGRASARVVGMATSTAVLVNRVDVVRVGVRRVANPSGKRVSGGSKLLAVNPRRRLSNTRLANRPRVPTFGI